MTVTETATFAQLADQQHTRVPTNFSDYLYYAAPLKNAVMVRYGFRLFYFRYILTKISEKSKL